VGSRGAGFLVRIFQSDDCFGVFGELGSARKDWRGGGEWVPSLERRICVSVDFFFELRFGLARGQSRSFCTPILFGGQAGHCPQLTLD
jgi:hypothetical protein